MTKFTPLRLPFLGFALTTVARGVLLEDFLATLSPVLATLSSFLTFTTLLGGSVIILGVCFLPETLTGGLTVAFFSGLLAGETMSLSSKRFGALGFTRIF